MGYSAKQRSAKAVRKIIVSSTIVAILAVSSIGMVHGQQGSPSVDLPHKIGLIDMAHVFKEYKKFKEFRESIKQDIDRSQQQAELMQKRLLGLQQEMKMLKPESKEYVVREKELIREKNNYDIFRQDTKRTFLKKESELYKTIYLEVAGMVQKYAGHYQYTVIFRFNRKSVQDANDSKEILASMNRQVVYHQTRDDITIAVLKALNSQYAKTAGSNSAGTRTGRNLTPGIRRK
jgi:Skp family chaperone for outer membrane proteins